MNSTAGSPTSQPSLAGKVATAVFLWLASCLLGGYLVARVIHEHGSILFLYLGTGIALSGAVSHAVLLQGSSFRAKSIPVQALQVWASAIVILSIIATLFALGGSGSRASAVRESLVVVILYAAPSMLVPAIGITALLKRSASA